MKRMLFVLVILAVAGAAFAQPQVSGLTLTYSKTCTLGIAKACTTDVLSVLNLGGFSFQLWDSVKADTSSTLTIKVQGSYWNRPAAFTSTGFTDSLPVNALVVTQQGIYSGIYDITGTVPRVPWIRYILTNSGSQGRLWVKFGTACNENK